MTTAFSFPCQKVLQKYAKDPDIAPIMKDIANAQQGVVTFSKDVKKYMLKFIHERYDNNEEVNTLIEILKHSGKYESFNFLEIFQLQDEAYFWYDFLNCYALWKIIGKTYGFIDSDDAIRVLVRLVRNDMTIFNDYAELTKK
ncbi:MAG: hypothetical protein IJ978_01150 [Clostridia bacterium]|jgi:hypothetical protein|nr:hypothetical protein [Clostridia bacterium]MBQ9107995.1 hypothetical protein [Clostridia bacterium]MBR2056245.1 hypothetical protein [Clostridia bacterium]MBR2486155.1 hypothetical protein [Clostridia bacterium]MBR2919342.1 hypothetical protein [Clostridia bacterium]